MNLSESQTALATAPLKGARPLKGAAEPYAFARACGYGIWEATRRAGRNPETGQGSKLEARSDVQARIAWWRTFQQTDEMLAEKRALIERELQIVGMASMDDFVSLIPSGDAMIPVLDLTRIHALPEDQRRVVMAAVKTVKYTENGPTLELHGKLDALSQLRDMHGLKAATKSEWTGKDGGPIEVLEYTDADRIRAVQALIARAASAPKP